MKYSQDKTVKKGENIDPKSANEMAKEIIDQLSFNELKQIFNFFDERTGDSIKMFCEIDLKDDPNKFMD